MPDLADFQTMKNFPIATSEQPQLTQKRNKANFFKLFLSSE